jgi:hypothetical protein
VAYVDVANGFELQVVAACVIGGISTMGGTGRVLGCLFGALFLGVINNALPVIGVSPFWQMAISGTVIVIAVLLNERGNKRKGRLNPARCGAGTSENGGEIMSKMMTSEEIKNEPAPAGFSSACCAGKVFAGGHAGGVCGERPGLALFPQYLEPLGRDLQLHRKSDHRAANGDADYRPGN